MQPERRARTGSPGYGLSPGEVAPLRADQARPSPGPGPAITSTTKVDRTGRRREHGGCRAPRAPSRWIGPTRASVPFTLPPAAGDLVDRRPNDRFGLRL